MGFTHSPTWCLNAFLGFTYNRRWCLSGLNAQPELQESVSREDPRAQTVFLRACTMMLENGEQRAPAKATATDARAGGGGRAAPRAPFPAAPACWPMAEATSAWRGLG